MQNILIMFPLPQLPTSLPTQLYVPFLSLKSNKQTKIKKQKNKKNPHKEKRKPKQTSKTSNMGKKNAQEKQNETQGLYHRIHFMLGNYFWAWGLP